MARSLSDVVQFAPVAGLVLTLRVGRTSRRTKAVDDEVVLGADEVTRAQRWWERQRRHLANEDRPCDIEKKGLVCRRGHRLLWLVRSPWGSVPVARTAQGGVSMRSSAHPDPAPMTLQTWPAGEHLPIASCGCHDHVEVSVHEARRWLEARRDKFVYPP